MTFSIVSRAARTSFSQPVRTSQRISTGLGRRLAVLAKPAMALAAMLLSMGTSAVAHAQITFQPNWVQQSPATKPSARYGYGIAYDSAHGQVVLFGGGIPTGDPEVPDTLLSDTWVWDGTNWTQLNPAASPSGRAYAGMAYDATRGKVVLFGGSNGSVLNDTWEWDGTNWTPLNPAASPSGRAPDAAMTYDAAHQQVVLFGGLYSGGYLGDTWVWNGTNWAQSSPATNPPADAIGSMAYDAAQQQVIQFGGQTFYHDGTNETWAWDGSNWTQQGPANSPSARFGQAMAYDAAYGQIVLFGGVNTENTFGDTWLWNGSNWTQENPPASPSARWETSMAYDAGHDQMVLFGGADSSGNALGDTWTWGQGDFGSQAIGSSSTQTLNFFISSGTAVGSIGVLTQGAPSLDFSDAGGSTCTAKTYGSDTSCTINVKFKPPVAGLREGAVVFYSGAGLSGTQLASVPIYGSGTGPQIAYGPAVQTTVGSGLSQPAGVAVDAAGDVFIANFGNNRVVELPAGGGAQTTVGSGYREPTGVAVDGAGDVFIVDGNGRVLKVPAGGGAETTVGSGLNAPGGVAVDGAGDVFIADQGGQVVKVPAGGGAQTTVGSGLGRPYGVAVDGAGDVFIADPGINQVVEVPAGGGAQTTVGSGLNGPLGVAVDGAGDVFIGDPGNNRVVEVPAGGGAQITVGSGLSQPSGVAVDAAGDVFIADFNNNRVVELQRSQPPTLAFPTATVEGTTDTTDGTMTAQIMNIGNRDLNLAATLSYPADFSDPGGDSSACVSSTSLSAGQECDVPVQFTPQNSGPLSENVTLTDNNLNVSGAQQGLAVTGTGIAPTLSATCSSTNAGTVNVSFSSGPESVMGGVPDYTFYVGSGSVPNGLTLTTSTGAITGTPATSGAFSIAVKDSKGTVAATSCPFTMVAPPLVITWPTPAAITYLTPLSGTQLDASASEPGSFSYDPGMGTEFAAGPQTLHATFTPTDTKDYSVTMVQVTLQVNKATPVVSWSPAPLLIDDKLTSAQLDATANVPGKFVYTPALGTEIKTATETLKVVFTPTDSKDYNSVTGTVSLPVSEISVSPTSINYGTVYLGSVTYHTVTVTNEGSTAVSIYNPLISILTVGDSREFQADNLCPASLAAHKSCTMKIAYVAGAFYHQQSATLRVMNSSPGSPQSVSLTALTIDPEAKFSATSLSFGTQKEGTTSAAKTVTLSNPGATALTIKSLAMSGADAGDFKQTNNCGSSLAAGANCTVSITFKSGAKGARSAKLVLTDNAQTGSLSLSLSGTGD